MRLRLVTALFALLALPLGLVAMVVMASEGPPNHPARAVQSAGPSMAMSIDLGRVICGDCCVGNLWKALGNLPGVRDIDARAGNEHLVVYYDPAATQPELVLARLIASGEATATLMPAGAATANPGTERRWKRPVRR